MTDFKPLSDSSAADTASSTQNPSATETRVTDGGAPAELASPSPGAGRSTSTPLGVSPSASGGWFATTMLMVALFALVLSGLLWQRLDRIQQELARRSADVAEESEKSRDSADQALTQVQELQARLSVAEVKLSEVTLQRTQLEELMLSVSRSRDDTLVLDIESGIRLAMQQAELTGSAQPLLAALQAADRRIGKAAQPRLNPVQRAMARDMERIKASAVADLPLLASRLDELARAVDEWPLANAEPRKRHVSSQLKPARDAAKSSSAPGAIPARHAPDASTSVGPQAGGGHAPEGSVDSAREAATGDLMADPRQGEGVAVANTAPDGHSKAVTESHPPKKVAADKPRVHADAAVTQPPSSEPPATGWVGSVRSWWSGWWDKLASHVLTATRDLVRVSRIEEPDAVLLSPDQALFLRENIKLRLLNARLSLLSRQVSASRADMQVAKAALAKYFDAQAPVNRAAQQSLADMLAASRSLELPRPEETLAALAKAAGGR